LVGVVLAFFFSPLECAFIKDIREQQPKHHPAKSEMKFMRHFGLVRIHAGLAQYIAPFRRICRSLGCVGFGYACLELLSDLVNVVMIMLALRCFSCGVFVFRCETVSLRKRSS